MSSIPANRGDSKLGAAAPAANNANGSAANPVAENTWRGRTVHEGRPRPFIQAFLAAIITAVGIVLAFTGSPIKGTLAIGAGLYWLNSLRENWNNNDLECALRYLTGTSNFNSLPKIDLTVKDRRFENLTIDKFTNDITAIAVGGKVKGIAFKYLDRQKNDRPTVSIYDFTCSFEERLISGAASDTASGTSSAFMINVTNKLTAKDGQMFYDLFVKSNAGDRKAQA